jgi:hypothetical protein
MARLPDQIGILTLFACLFAGTSSAATWHVDNRRGNDTHDGRAPGRAFKTIARAVKAAQVSDALSLANTGVPYLESIRLVGGGGTPSKPFTIEGNGAVISGLRPVATNDWKRRSDGVFEISGHRPYGFPTLLIDGRQTPEGNPDALQPGQWAWPRKPDTRREGVLRFRPGYGKTPADYRLEATLGESGLQISSSSYVTVRNLISEFHSNDGFNIHGTDCRGFLGENIEGRFNGDDGFSIHESIEAVVRNAWFHHNGSGIEDVNLSRSFYSGIRVHDNRRTGVLFIGAFHSAVDALVENNPVNFRIASSVTRHLVGSEHSPIRETSVYLQNVVTVGGNVGVSLAGSARLMVLNSIFREAQTGIESIGDSQLHLTKSVVVDCEKHELSCRGKSFYGDYNIYHPGRFNVAGKEYTADDWTAFLSAVGHHEHALIKNPALTKSHRIGEESARKIDKHTIGPTAFYY